MTKPACIMRDVGAADTRHWSGAGPAALLLPGSILHAEPSSTACSHERGGARCSERTAQIVMSHMGARCLTVAGSGLVPLKSSSCADLISRRLGMLVMVWLETRVQKS